MKRNSIQPGATQGRSPSTHEADRGDGRERGVGGDQGAERVERAGRDRGAVGARRLSRAPIPNHDFPPLRAWLELAAQNSRAAKKDDARFAHAPHRGRLIRFRRQAAGHDALIRLTAEEAWDNVYRAWPDFLDCLGVLSVDGFTDDDEARACWISGWDEIRCPVGYEPDRWALRMAQRFPLDLARVWAGCGERETRLASAAAWLQVREGVQAPIYLPCRKWGDRLGVKRTWVSDACRHMHALDVLRTEMRSTGERIATRVRFACHRFPELHAWVSNWGWGISERWLELEHAYASLRAPRITSPRGSLLVPPEARNTGEAATVIAMDPARRSSRRSQP